MTIGNAIAGFLLVALPVAILIFVATPIYGPRKSSKTNATKATLSMCKSALHDFHTQFDRYPTTAEGLDILVENRATLPDWRPFMEKVPQDVWGNTLRYTSPGARHPDSYDLFSPGPDGVFGTADDLSTDDL